LKKLLSLAVLLAALGFGCAHHDKNAGLRFYPDKEEQGLYGYHTVAGTTGSIENSDYRIAVKQVRADDELGQPKIIDDLLKRRYVILRLVIENHSTSRITFNPARTALTTDTLDYKKPLEYIDFFDLSSGKNDRIKEREAAEIKGRIYDLTVTVEAGDRTSRMLVFPPLTEGSEKADLLIKDLYVGTDTSEIYFPFVLKPDTLSRQ